MKEIIVGPMPDHVIEKLKRMLESHGWPHRAVPESESPSSGETGCYSAALEEMASEVEAIAGGEPFPDGDYPGVPGVLWAERWSTKLQDAKSNAPEDTSLLAALREKADECHNAAETYRGDERRTEGLEVFRLARALEHAAGRLEEAAL